MLKKSTPIIIFLFIQLLLINSVLAGEASYYSPEGNLITKEKYLELSKEVRKKTQKIKMERIQSKLKETDEYGRPKFDYRNGEIVHLIYRKPKTKKLKVKENTRLQYGRRYIYPIKKRREKKRPQYTGSYREEKRPQYKDRYIDEKLKDERILRKLQILHEVRKMESLSLERDRQMIEDFRNINRNLQDFGNRYRRFEDFRNRNGSFGDFLKRRQLDDIEQNTMEIKRKLDWGW